MNTALQLMKELLISFFVEHDIKKALDTLSNDIYACGFANDMVVNGLYVTDFYGKVLWSRLSYHLLQDPVTGHICLYEYVYDISTEKDIRMPVMDGLEATRQIRALERPDAKSIPIIAMTVNALEEDRNNSKAAGMNEHLAKPIAPKKLYQTLAEQIKFTRSEFGN